MAALLRSAFCDLEFERNRPINVEELALLAERVEKLTEILKRHDGNPVHWVCSKLLPTPHQAPLHLMKSTG